MTVMNTKLSNALYNTANTTTLQNAIIAMGWPQPQPVEPVKPRFFTYGCPDTFFGGKYNTRGEAEKEANKWLQSGKRPNCYILEAIAEVEKEVPPLKVTELGGYKLAKLPEASIEEDEEDDDYLD